jgi:hypothetical protein
VAVVCKDGGTHLPDISSNRVRAPGTAAAGIGLGALECVAVARLRSTDKGDGPVMDSPTSGDQFRGGYKNHPAAAIISYAPGGYPNGTVGGAVDWGGRDRVTEELELPIEACSCMAFASVWRSWSCSVALCPSSVAAASLFR